MSKLFEAIRQKISVNKPLPPGIYQYISPPDDPRNYRLHLRIEYDGTGILIINASSILHLNQTATELAYYLVKNINPDEAAIMISKRYDITIEQAKHDYIELIEKIQTLINTPDLDPVTFLGFDRLPPFTGYISAPYRLDLAITYQLPENIDPESAPIDRVSKELHTNEWLDVIDKAMEYGIPHLVFTGGEPTLRDDLTDFLNRAEENNQVTGLLTNGIKFADQDYLERILQTGLDHLMMILKPDIEESWTALQNLLDADLYISVHLTITNENKDKVMDLIKKLANMSVKSISLSARGPELDHDLLRARDLVADLNMDLVWNLPVPYSAANPIALETVHNEIEEGAGRAWFYIEPDGDVLPSQGINQVLGNALKDKWDEIWMRSHSK